MERVKENNGISKKNYLLSNNLKNISGITLIALVITIIVLLILAGVSIASLTGDNGILTRADTARKETNKQSVQEQVQVEVLGSMGKNGDIDIDRLNENLKNIVGLKYGEGEISESNKIESLPAKVKIGEYNIEIEENGEIAINEIEVGEKVTGGNKEYTKNGTAVIPEGFAIVPGLDDVSQGLVISDDPNDTEINKDSIVAKGNQFVWIPVDKATFGTKFKRTEGYYNGNLQDRLSSCGEADGTGENSYLKSKGIEESDITKQEAKAMYASVKRNGGFYIGRYATGKETDGTVVCKKGVEAYGNIIWGKSMTEEGEEGAVYESRKFAGDKGYTSVVSTLCYGVQWDAALNFIDSNYITNEINGQPNCKDDSYVKDSTGKGNYNEDANTHTEWKGSLTETGKVSEYAEKNIYDMAGNLWEWTMESCYTDNRVYRGGCFIDTGSQYPVSERAFSTTTGSGNSGFRLTLYVKD